MASQRICIIGDSHVAALKTGWDAMGDTAHDVTFFAAPLPMLAHIAIDDGKLIATDPKLEAHFVRTSGGRTAIEDVYDAYIVCGQGLGFYNAQYVYNRCRMPELEPLEDALELTREAFEAAVDEHQEKSRALQTLDKLRQITKAPLLVVAMPIPTREGKLPIWKKLERNGDKRKMLEIFRESCERLAVLRGARFLPQPPETFAEDGTTRTELGRAGARLRATEVKDDLYHMNGVYGEIVLRAAFAALQIVS
jgi:hypothetical protein